MLARRTLWSAALLATAGSPLQSQSLASRIDAILARPAFHRTSFGVEFRDVASGRALYRHNAELFFVPGSTTKVPTSASALQLLGANYRFHTKVYRTGPINADGTLDGDLVLVASGDPNLSGRIQPDGSLTFRDEDHSYGSSPGDRVAGDPLAVLRGLARQVGSRGIKRVGGRIRVDISLFPEGERELGTGVVISPIVVNDNLVDVVVTPSAQGSAVKVAALPATSYVTLVNHATTDAATSKPSLRWGSDVANSDGSRTITLEGSLPEGKPAAMITYPAAEPSRFAELAFADLLHEAGVVGAAALREDKPDWKALAASYDTDHMVAEHVSPPMTEAVKVILKVSQNLHASMMPYVLGALLAKKGTAEAGFDLIQGWEKAAGLDLSGQSQGDGAGGMAHFAPEFMVQLLIYMTHQKEFQAFYDALPVLGKDGTLVSIQTASPAAGHVHAKTGTFAEDDKVGHGLLVNGKGLAGYVDTKDGRRLAFTVYINNTHVASNDEVSQLVGQAAGEIAAAAYDAR